MEKHGITPPARRSRSRRLITGRWAFAVLLVVGLALLPAACSTTRAYKEALGDWVGLSEQKLIEFWGEPDKKTELADGARELQYKRDRTLTVPGEFAVGSRIERTRSYEDRQVRYWCVTNFKIDAAGKVTGFNFKGNDCKERTEE